MDAFVEPIKQYAGQVQVTRSVVVNVPGKHFPALQPSEQAEFYPGTAVEFKERHRFARHPKAWGAEHTGPGIRFICKSDAIDDPNHSGFWTTLLLGNKWRHETYKDNRDAEKQFLDELPAEAPATAAPATAKEKSPPEIKQHFTITSTGVHTYGGNGRLSGTTVPCAWYACKKPGCARDARNPIKQVGTATGQLFTHLDSCQPQLCLRLRAASKHSPVDIDENGEAFSTYTFDELLPHHALFVEKCFRGLDHFYETRADNGLKEWVCSFDKRAAMPDQQTCTQLLETYEELYDERIMRLIARHKDAYGTPCAGSTTDIWSLSSCRESFACMRGSFVFDGDMVAQVTGDDSCKGTLVDMSPLLAFERMQESHHTGAAIARWKTACLKKWQLEGAIGLATEDGASPNKKANKILKQEMAVCVPHDIARAVLLASGEDGKPCRNPELKALIARSSKQAGSFSRSVVANKALQQAQLDANDELKEHQTLTTKTKNKTRWLGLRALDSSDEESEGSDGDDQEEANRAAGNAFPLAHRCLSSTDFRHSDIFESLLDRPRETTLLVQDETKGFGEGLDIGLCWLTIEVSAALNISALPAQSERFVLRTCGAPGNA